MLGFQNTKAFLLKGTPSIGQKKFLLLVKSKTQFVVISDLNGEPTTGSFYEKELQKSCHKKFRIEKVIKRKGNKFFFKWKGYDNSFSSWIKKKELV